MLIIHPSAKIGIFFVNCKMFAEKSAIRISFSVDSHFHTQTNVHFKL